jgi:hypothetical protein
MAETKTKKSTEAPATVEERLLALYTLQQIDSRIDEIRTVRGELPLEVQDLEDEIGGLETRIGNINDEISGVEQDHANQKNTIEESKALIKKYEDQQNKVRNNREFDSLTKELEYQNLEIQLAEKRIKEADFGITSKKEILAAAQEKLDSRAADLKHKKDELDGIIAETQKDEESLLKKSKKAEKVIEERLVSAYTRVRTNARNGLAVVRVERDACGGCFNKIPPQRTLDISTHKKIIVCEHCGRILVDDTIHDQVVVTKK